MRVSRIALRSLALVALLLGLAPAAISQTTSSISVHLNNGLSTENARPGDTFSATLAEPLVQNGRAIAPRGAIVNGEVIDAVSSGRLKRPAELTLRLTSVESGGRTYPINSGNITIKAGSHTTRNLVIIGGSAGAGAVIGGVTGGGKGAAIGAAAGAGAGTLAAFLTGKKEIELPAETQLTFENASVAGSSAPRGADGYSRSGSRESGDRDRDRASGDRERERDRRGSGSGYRDNDADRRASRDPVFSRSERDLISGWFGTNRSNLPPGLAKRDRLPPGLEKQLRERGTLPPGLQKRAQPLPYDLERQLPRLPSGYRRSVVAGNVILLDERTGLIADIIRNVLR